MAIAKLYHDTNSGALTQVKVICEPHGEAFANPKPDESENDTIRRAASQIGCTCKITQKQADASGSMARSSTRSVSSEPVARMGLSGTAPRERAPSRTRAPATPSTYRSTNPPDQYQSRATTRSTVDSAGAITFSDAHFEPATKSNVRTTTSAPSQPPPQKPQRQPLSGLDRLKLRGFKA